MGPNIELSYLVTVTGFKESTEIDYWVYNTTNSVSEKKKKI
jgi:hypothetical protein